MRRRCARDRSTLLEGRPSCHLRVQRRPRVFSRLPPEELIAWQKHQHVRTRDRVATKRGARIRRCPRTYSCASPESGSDGAASFAGASQLNVASVGPWNVHSAAAACTIFFGLPDLSASACASDDADGEAAAAPTPDAVAPAAVAAPEAADVAEPLAGLEAAEAPAAPDALEAPDAPEAPPAAAASDAVTPCSIAPSTTTREPPMPAPVWPILSVSDEVSASLLRINCSHASEFLYTVVQAASSAVAVATHARVRIRIFIDVPFFKPSRIVAWAPCASLRLTSSQ